MLGHALTFFNTESVFVCLCLNTLLFTIHCPPNFCAKIVINSIWLYLRSEIVRVCVIVKAKISNQAKEMAYAFVSERGKNLCAQPLYPQNGSNSIHLY